jgi:hypothetical protein
MYEYSVMYKYNTTNEYNAPMIASAAGLINCFYSADKQNKIRFNMAEDYSHSDACGRLYKLIKPAAVGSVG